MKNQPSGKIYIGLQHHPFPDQALSVKGGADVQRQATGGSMRQHAGTTTKILCLTAVVRSWGFRLKKVLLRIFAQF